MDVVMCVCLIHNVAAFKLTEEFAIMRLPSYYSICPSQPKYEVRLCPLYTEHFINYFSQKLTFFFKFNNFQSLKLFFRDFSLSAHLAENLDIASLELRSCSTKLLTQNVL